MGLIKSLWFTLNCLFRFPERTFSYIVNRLGDSHKNFLIATWLFVSWLNLLLFTKHDTLLGFMLGSCFLLPIAYFVMLYVIKLGAALLVFVVEKCSGTLDEFSAELVLVYSFLPISICSAVAMMLCHPFLLDGSTAKQSVDIVIILLSKIMQCYLLFKGLKTLAKLYWRKTIWASLNFVLLPYFLFSLIGLLITRVWN